MSLALAFVAVVGERAAIARYLTERACSAAIGTEAIRELEQMAEDVTAGRHAEGATDA